jgi:hypothetical protein
MLLDAGFEVAPGLAEHPLDGGGDIAGDRFRCIVTEDGEIELVRLLRPIAPGDLEAEAGMLRDGVGTVSVAGEAVEEGERVRDHFDTRRAGREGDGEVVIRPVFEGDPGSSVHGVEPSIARRLNVEYLSGLFQGLLPLHNIGVSGLVLLDIEIRILL